MRLRSVTLGKMIADRRKQLKMSQKHLNNVCGWFNSQGQVVSNIERGYQQVPLKVVNQISLALQLSREEIIRAMIADYEINIREELNKLIEVKNEQNISSMSNDI